LSDKTSEIMLVNSSPGDESSASISPTMTTASQLTHDKLVLESPFDSVKKRSAEGSVCQRRMFEASERVYLRAACCSTFSNANTCDTSPNQSVGPAASFEEDEPARPWYRFYRSKLWSICSFILVVELCERLVRMVILNTSSLCRIAPPAIPIMLCVPVFI
jgi:hypothetical protein